MSRSRFGQPPTPQLGMAPKGGMPQSGPKMAQQQMPGVRPAVAGTVRNAISPKMPMPMKGPRY